MLGFKLIHVSKRASGWQLSPPTFQDYRGGCCQGVNTTRENEIIWPEKHRTYHVLYVISCSYVPVSHWRVRVHWKYLWVDINLLFLFLVYSVTYQFTRFNTLRSRQNGRHFADDTFKLIFLNENCCILIKMSLILFSIVQVTRIQHWSR